jgi:hypothetical protein
LIGRPDAPAVLFAVPEMPLKMLRPVALCKAKGLDGGREKRASPSEPKKELGLFFYFQCVTALGTEATAFDICFGLEFASSIRCRFIERNPGSRKVSQRRRR